MRKCLVGAIALLAVAAPLYSGCDLEIDQPHAPQGPTGPFAVVFELDGPLPQLPNPAGLLGGVATSQHKLTRLLTRAASDIQVQEVVIHIGAPEIGWARAAEIGDVIARVGTTGKPVTCHLEAADNKMYWMAASSCPRIQISPAGGIDLVGLSVEAVYAKDLLDSIGLTADMMQIGRYKDAAEPLTSNEMSPEAREAMMGVLDDMHRQLLTGVATGRNIENDSVLRLIDEGPYTANQSKAKGLVDEVKTLGAYLDTLRDKHAGGVVDDYGKQPPKPLGLTDVLEMLGGGDKAEATRSQPHVALIPAVGPIVSGSRDELLGGMEVVYDVELVDTLAEVARDPTVKSVVLRIDSPGGSALASDNIWEAVRALAASKPVVASMGDTAASGGYYIASPATEILASEATLTGSIGVVGGKLVLTDMLTKIGLHTESMSRGHRAGIGSPLKPFTEDERQAIRALMHDAYDLFIKRVVSGRGIVREKVLAAAEGRVWTGSQAIAAGLVTRSGTLTDAIDRARELGALPGGPVEIHPKPQSLMELLSETFAEQEPGVFTAASRLAPTRHALALFSLLRRQRVLAFAPMFVEIR